MNRAIVKFYDTLRNSELGLDAVKTAIRCEDASLLERCLQSNSYDNNLWEFALNEMASSNILKLLSRYGYARLEAPKDITPFHASPYSIVELYQEIYKVDESEAIKNVFTNVSYFIRVFKSDYSVFRIPNYFTTENAYSPSFFDYIDWWFIEFYNIYRDRKLDWKNLAYIIIGYKELKSASILYASLYEYNLGEFLNQAIANNNEIAFDYLLKKYIQLPQSEQAKVKPLISSYPPCDSPILDKMLTYGLLLSGNYKAFNALIHLIRFNDNDSLLRYPWNKVLSSSYTLLQTDEYDNTIFSSICRNDEFPFDSLPIFLALHQGDKSSLLHIAAKEMDIELIIELIGKYNANPFMKDYNGDNALHVLIREMMNHIIRADFCSLYELLEILQPEILLEKNNEDKTPLDILSEFLISLCNSGETEDESIPQEEFQKLTETIVKNYNMFNDL